MEKGIVKYETEHGQVVLSPEIIKRYLVSGSPEAVTPQEVMLFLNICRYQRLNPFLREAYLIKYSPKYPASIVVGKDVFTKRAAKNPNCAGWRAGVIVQTEDGKLLEREGSFVLPNESLVGGWAIVFRRDWEQPFKVTVGINEYLKENKEGQTQRNWATMPATMIRKVALVQALREAFPEDFQGLYAPEEFGMNGERFDAQPIEVEVTEEKEKQEETQDKKSPQQAKRKATEARKITQAQIGLIERLTSEEELKEVLDRELGGKSLEELTVQEASQLIGLLKGDQSPF